MTNLSIRYQKFTFIGALSFAAFERDPDDRDEPTTVHDVGRIVVRRF